MVRILERLSREWLFFDGGTGSVLQEMGLQPGELPESWNLSHPEEVRALHTKYLQAGCTVFNTNTFGANRLHFPDNLEEIVQSAVSLAREARRQAGREEDAYVALDIGPTGKLLEPMGDLPFEEAVSLFGEVARIGAEAGADLVLIETMNDSYEAKAAVLGAKENCQLPVFLTMVFDENGRMLTGGTPESMTAMLEGLRVDALGVNCSLGPKQMIPVVERLLRCASTPIIVNPNAGLPRAENGKTIYDLDAESFSDYMYEIARLGVQGVGGCCGTTPEHIRKTIEKVSPLPVHPPVPKQRTMLSSYSRCVELGGKPLLIGERINPTGKKRFKEALRGHDLDYILSQGLLQEEAGADVLDVNVGLPEIDEQEMLRELVQALQELSPIPLQIDTSDPAAMETALRLYNGKAMLNSVNGKQSSMDSVFPLAAKYGAVVVALPLDERGIPDTADGRIAIAEKIYAEAAKYGIARKDIVVDGLCMAVSADSRSARVTLETVRRIREELSGRSILGVSNVSFGLPERESLNAAFFTMAMQAGLDAAILNPNNEAMMRSYRAFVALSGQDPAFQAYLAACETWQKAAEQRKAAEQQRLQDGAKRPEEGRSGSGAVSGAGAQSGSGAEKQTGEEGGGQGMARKRESVAESATPLYDAVVRGLTRQAEDACREALTRRDGMQVVDEELLPALDKVGKGFEAGTLFLPQLLLSAEAAKAAFELVKESMAGSAREQKGRVILATVKGDVHDIGKNIVKVMLENYGYGVLDLGKDVAPERIVETALREGIRVVGLSALMTTTVPSMAETIRQLRARKPEIKVVVGGAVLNADYADMIGADRYAKDAMATVRFCDEVFA